MKHSSDVGFFFCNVGGSQSDKVAVMTLVMSSIMGGLSATYLLWS